MKPLFGAQQTCCSADASTPSWVMSPFALGGENAPHCFYLPWVGHQDKRHSCTHGRAKCSFHMFGVKEKWSLARANVEKKARIIWQGFSECLRKVSLLRSLVTLVYDLTGPIKSLLQTLTSLFFERVLFKDFKKERVAVLRIITSPKCRRHLKEEGSTEANNDQRVLA